MCKIDKDSLKYHTCMKVVQMHYLIKFGRDSKRNKVRRTTSAREGACKNENGAFFKFQTSLLGFSVEYLPHVLATTIPN